MGRLAVVPSRAAVDTRLPDGTLRTLVVLAAHANRDGWCWPSQALLAGERGLGRTTIHGHLQALEEAGYVESRRQQRPNGSEASKVYRVLYDTNLAEPEATPPVGSEPTPPVGQLPTPPVGSGPTPLTIPMNGANERHAHTARAREAKVTSAATEIGQSLVALYVALTTAPMSRGDSDFIAEAADHIVLDDLAPIRDQVEGLAFKSWAGARSVIGRVAATRRDGGDPWAKKPPRRTQVNVRSSEYSTEPRSG